MMRRMQRLHLFHVIVKVLNNLFFPMELLQTIHSQGILVYFICSFFRSPYVIIYVLILIFSRRSLVDYEDDEDDEDYKPPPKKKPEASEEDEGIMESLRMKRKLPSKDKEPELVKKQKLPKNSKSKDSVFAALCSTLSQAVLPSKKSAINIHMGDRTVEGRMSSSEDNQEDGENVSRSSSDNSNIGAEDNHVEQDTSASRSFSDCLHAKTDNTQLGGEERPLVPPKTSPEMAVNGS